MTRPYAATVAVPAVVLLLMMATVACSRHSASPTTTALAPSVAADGQAACAANRAGWLPEPGKTARLSISSGGRERSALVRLPKGYDPAQPTRTALLVDFHGHGGSGQAVQRRHGFDPLADSVGFIAAYPDGTIEADNARGWATGSQRSDRGDIDDVAFVNDLVDRLDADLCLDSAHRWAVGHSNGGGLVGILACESADRFTSFVAVSGAFYGQPGPCEPIRPIRLLEVHGDADPLVSYTGLAKAGVVVFPPISEWLAGWAARQSCAASPLARRPGGRRTQGRTPALGVPPPRNSRTYPHRRWGP